MARPETKRRVSRKLKDQFFKPRAIPMDRLELVTVSLDGLEALRLADVEGLYQEEAAERMGVSRATFGRILSTARRSVADALLNGKAVDIGGGTIERHRTERWPCPIHGRRQRRGRGCRCESTGERKGRRRQQGGKNAE